MSIRTHLLRLLFGGGLAASASVQAASPEVALRDLHAARLGILETLAAFQAYQGAEGDPRKGQALRETLEETRRRLDAMPDTVSDYPVATEMDVVIRQWETATQQLGMAMTAIDLEGFADFAVMDRYTQASLAAEKTLGTIKGRIVEHSGHTPDTVVDLLRSQALLMQAMTTAYIERSNSQFGASYRADQSEEETIDAMAMRFSRGVDTLNRKIPLGHPHRALLDDVRSQWGFLEKSFMNYTENNVPNLVGRFSQDMIDALGKLAAAMEPSA